MIWKAGIWKKYYVFHLSDFTIQYWENFWLSPDDPTYFCIFLSLNAKIMLSPNDPSFFEPVLSPNAPLEGGPYTRIHFIFDCPPPGALVFQAGYHPRKRTWNMWLRGRSGGLWLGRDPGGVGGSVKIGDWVFDLVGVFPWLRSFGLTFRLLVLREYSYLGVFLSAVTIWSMLFVLVSCC